MTDNLTPYASSAYDSQIVKTVPYYDCFYAETVSLVRSFFQRPGHWLDTGCGTGTLVAQALRQFPGCRFYLADPSAKMLEICRQRLSEKQAVIIGPYDTASLESHERFDVISAIQCHHYLSERQRKQATEKCHALLQEAGLYITFENVRFESSLGNEKGLKRWGTYQTEQGRTESQVQEHLARFDKNYFPIIIEQHLHLLKQTGFKVAQLFWMSNMQAGFYAVK